MINPSLFSHRQPYRVGNLYPTARRNFDADAPPPHNFPQPVRCWWDILASDSDIVIPFPLCPIAASTSS